MRLSLLEFIKVPIVGSLIGKELLERIRKFEPRNT